MSSWGLCCIFFASKINIRAILRQSLRFGLYSMVMVMRVTPSKQARRIDRNAESIPSSVFINSIDQVRIIEIFDLFYR
jgi:hypothetical protein